MRSLVIPTRLRDSTNSPLRDPMHSAPNARIAATSFTGPTNPIMLMMSPSFPWDQGAATLSDPQVAIKERNHRGAEGTEKRVCFHKLLLCVLCASVAKISRRLEGAH